MKIYTPDSERHTGLVQILCRLVNNLTQYRGLIWQLFKRDFLASYKKSFLGYAWLFVSPVIAVVSWVILNRAGVLKPGSVGVPYGVYVLVGTTLWTFFSGAVTAASGTLTSSAGLITQVKYPHEVFLFKQLAQHLANFLISFFFVITVSLFYGLPLHAAGLLLPFALIPLYLLAIGLGLVVALVGAVVTDIASAVTYGLGFLIYLTPIIYSSDVAGEGLKTLFRWNPLTYLVCSPRDLILYGQLSHAHGYLIATGFSLLTFILAWRTFCAAESQLVERMV